MILEVKSARGGGGGDASPTGALHYPETRQVLKLSPSSEGPPYRWPSHLCAWAGRWAQEGGGFGLQGPAWGGGGGQGLLCGDSSAGQACVGRNMRRCEPSSLGLAGWFLGPIGLVLWVSRVPGDGTLCWSAHTPDAVCTPLIGSAWALSWPALHLAPSQWVGLGSTQGVVWCGVVWCGVVWCGVVWCGVVWCGVVWGGVV